MRSYIKIISLVFVFIVNAYIHPSKIHAQNEPVSMQVFYDQLSPYGQWINDPSYGYVWVPDVVGFSPYSSNGYWIYSDAGWTWVSNYSWGWAPFHYGRWNYLSYGWAWIPDTEWAPAWVEWRSTPGYYGWAPLPYGNYDYSSNYDYWRFVRASDFGRANMYRYYVNRSTYGTLYGNSHSLNRGPDVVEIRHTTGRPFRPVVIKNYAKPGQQLTTENYTIYRPRIDRGTNLHPANSVDPANYGGMKTINKNVDPAKYGGMKSTTVPNSTNRPDPANYGGQRNTVTPNRNNRTKQTTKPDPANYGGIKTQPRSTPQNKPDPANYGGVRTQPQPAPQRIQQPQTPVQSRPDPANYGGIKSQPAPVQQSRPNPANYGGIHNQPSSAPPVKRPNPANYGGIRK